MRSSDFASTNINRKDLIQMYRNECVGEVSRAPAPPPIHQWIVQRLILALAQSKDKTFAMLQAPIDLFINKRLVRQPDLAIIHNDRREIITEIGLIGGPNIVIEVLTKSSYYLDTNIKIKDYNTINVNEYWIVDPTQKQVTVYQQINQQLKKFRTYTKEDCITTKQFSNIRIDLRQIFVDDVELERL